MSSTKEKRQFGFSEHQMRAQTIVRLRVIKAFRKTKRSTLVQRSLWRCQAKNVRGKWPQNRVPKPSAEGKQRRKAKKREANLDALIQNPRRVNQRGVGSAGRAKQNWMRALTAKNIIYIITYWCHIKPKSFRLEKFAENLRKILGIYYNIQIILLSSYTNISRYAHKK